MGPRRMASTGLGEAVYSGTQTGPEGKVSDLQMLEHGLHLRWQPQSCASCRYFRIHKTTAVVSECLLLGRTLGINTATEEHMLTTWAMNRVCDAWSKRPKNWEIRSEGVDRNPHWHDPYLPRTANEKRRKRLATKIGRALKRESRNA